MINNQQKKIHIFIFFHDLGLGGIQRKIVSIIKYSHSNNLYKDLFFHLILKEKKKFNFISALENDQFIVHFEPKLPFLRRFQDSFYTIIIFWLVWRYRPLCLFTFSQGLIELLLWIKKVFFYLPVKVIFSQDTILSCYNSSTYTTDVLNLQHIKTIFNKLDSIIVQTNFAKKDLIQNFLIKTNKITVIPNWFIPDISTVTPSLRSIDIIYVGRMTEQKNLLYLIKTIEKVVKQKKNLQCLLIGDGEEKNSIITYISKHNLSENIHILPATHDISQYICSAKILLLTSKFEGHPLVLLESMFYGAVPVVKKYPGCGEYVQDQVDGFIEKNRSSLVKKILFLLDHHKVLTTVSIQAKKTVLSKYSNMNIEKTLELILKI